jgi:hypothetical protein
MLTHDVFSFSLSFQEICEKQGAVCTCGASLDSAHAGRSDNPHRHGSTCAVRALYHEWLNVSREVWETRVKHVPARAFVLKHHEVAAAEEVIS